MKTLILKIQAFRDSRGQDLIEYALMAGFVAVAAGAVIGSCVKHQHDLLQGRFRDGGRIYAGQLSKRLTVDRVFA